MKKLLIIIIILFPFITWAQKGGVYINHVKLNNKAEKWCWAISQDNFQSMVFGVEQGVVFYDGVNQNFIKTPFTPLAIINDSTNGKLWLSGDEMTGVLEPESQGGYLFKLLEQRDYNTFKTIHLINDTVYFVSDSLIVRYNAANNIRINEFSTHPRLIDKTLVYKQRFFAIVEYFIHTIRNNALIELVNVDFPVDEFAYAVGIDFNNIILGTSAQNVYQFNGKAFSSVSVQSSYFEHNRITDGVYYQGNTLILTSLAGGIALFDFTTNTIIQQIGFFNGLPDDEIRSIFIDKDKGIWLSHEFGISRIDLKQGIENFSNYPGLKGNPISFTQFNNKVYVGTNNGFYALEQIKDYDEFFETANVPVNIEITEPEPELKPVQTESVNTEEASDEFTLFRFRKKKPNSETTEQSSVSQVDTAVPRKTVSKVIHRQVTVKKRSLKSINHYFKPVDGMYGKFSQMVIIDNNLLVAGNTGLYAIKSNVAEQLIKNVDIIHIYYHQPENSAYVVTDNGLYKVIVANDMYTIEHFAQTTNSTINSIAFEQDNIWVLAFDKTLLRCILENKKIKIINEAELTENPGQTFVVRNINDSTFVFAGRTIFSFNNDGVLKPFNNLVMDAKLIWNQDNFTWLHNKGHWELLEPKKHADFSNLLMRLKLLGGARYIQIDNQNNIWLVNDDNKLIKINSQSAIGSLDFGVKMVGVQSNSLNLPFNKRIQLPAGNNNLEITLSAPFYLLQQGILFSYKIEGLNNSWTEWNSNSQVSLGYIPAGKYKLHFRAKNAIGQIAEGQPIIIEVPKPFTQTIPFYLIIFAAASAIAYIILKIRIEILKKDKLILEQKVMDRTATIEDQKSKIERQHDEITQSIRYAKRIQQAMLPNDQIIEALLPNHFIYFNPRDIVSGDFYFFKPMGNRIIFVAADCTGHGVPGGFMSMLGISFLSEITSYKTDLTAAQIINQLRDKIKQTLGQTDSYTAQKDGMDLSICLINPDKKQIEFAGAFNPLYIVKNHELEIVKADRQPVSVYFNEATFTNHIIDVQPNDVFYMFSDGFADQIGGPGQRKFMSKNFKKLLLDVYTKPMAEQQLILNNTLKSWQGSNMQVDDILVIGFKL